MTNHISRWVAVSLCTVLFAASQALAASIPINNPSFETPVLADGNFVFVVPSWTFSGTSTGTFNPAVAHYPAQAPDGANVAFISQSNPDTLAQILSANLTADTVYVLQVDVGQRLDATTGPYLVELLAGGVVLSSNGTVTPAAGTFSTVSVQYAASGSSPQLGLPLEIRLVATGGSGVQVNFDNVRLTTFPLEGAPAASPLGIGILLIVFVVIGVRKLGRSTVA